MLKILYWLKNECKIFKQLKTQKLDEKNQKWHKLQLIVAITKKEIQESLLFFRNI